MKYKKPLKERQYKTGIHFWQSVQEDACALEVFDVYVKNRSFFMFEKDEKKMGGGEESKVGKNSGDSPPRKNNGDSPRKSSTDSPRREKNGSGSGGRSGLGSTGVYMTEGIHTIAFDGSRDIMKKSLKPLKISRGQIVRLSEGYSTKQLPLRPPFFCPLAGGFSQLDAGDVSFADPEGGYMTIAQAVAKKSAILTDNTALQVLALCCPQLRCTDLLPASSLNTFDQGLYRCFSTSENGFSLSSLYAAAAGISPLVLLIKPCKDGQVRQDGTGHSRTLTLPLSVYSLQFVVFPSYLHCPSYLPSSPFLLLLSSVFTSASFPQSSSLVNSTSVSFFYSNNHGNSLAP
jgi:hypothetical protein